MLKKIGSKLYHWFLPAQARQTHNVEWFCPVNPLKRQKTPHEAPLPYKNHSTVHWWMVQFFSWLRQMSPIRFHRYSGQFCSLSAVPLRSAHSSSQSRDNSSQNLLLFWCRRDSAAFQIAGKPQRFQSIHSPEDMRLLLLVNQSELLVCNLIRQKKNAIFSAKHRTF